MLICISRPHLTSGGYSGPEPSWVGLPGDDPDVPNGDVFLTGVSVSYTGIGNLDWYIDVDGGPIFSGTETAANISSQFAAGDYDFHLDPGSYVVTFHVGRNGAGYYADEPSVTFGVSSGCTCYTPEITNPVDMQTLDWSTTAYQCYANNNGCDDPATESWSVDDTTNFSIDSSGNLTDNGGLSSGSYPLQINYANECNNISVSVTVSVP